MRTIKFASLLSAAIGMGIVASPVHAFTPGACKDDVKKYCGDVKPGDGAIRDCMKSHEADFSPACKENIAEAKAKMDEKKKELEAACGADLKKFCANVTPGDGREFACLRSYDDKLSADCKDKMPKPMMGMHKGMKHHDDDADGHDSGPDGDTSTPPPAK